ncbi:thioester reductase domain-containing protein [Leptothoe spongobia]|uniref:Thioester reductase domain-containing protein n=1 Tax=Leptothoe spongobia TAU-MAC 1115 TaxID=1967444 RepID=A0A947GN09_9CYAN|nr:thioester reductase domain-containing protein [Leptothoe spongobia]MBT9315806.1 thioester reductase domain-containing protein [Leptothoe spongobia TAU-MAC 1115]
MEQYLTQNKCLFLTGATGFLGAFLLQELLEQTQAKIYCLVRTVDTSTGITRLQENLKHYGIWKTSYQKRIVPIVGDLSQPLLGMNADTFEALAKEIDSIYHSGAWLNYLYPYERLKAVNVSGTQEVLRLASQSKVKPVHFISSIAVFDSLKYAQKHLTELDLPIYDRDIYLGYSQSKRVAEQLVTKARDRGLPVCIYRPPFISGHSQTGISNMDDLICRLIVGCLQLGRAPELDFLLDLAPVDYVSRGIAYLSMQPDSIGKVFHLNNPQPFYWHQLIDWMQSSGFPIERVAYHNWVNQLRSIRSAHRNPLSPLRPFFRKRLADANMTLPELYQQSRRPRFDCQLTRTALSESGITCPAINASLLRTYFEYFWETGSLTHSDLPPRVSSKPLFAAA